MFIDEMIRKEIELNKQASLELQYAINELKDLINYILFFQNDSNHIKIKENFDIVLNNIVTFANTLGIKKTMELLVLCSFLIHNGFLSEKVDCYVYNSNKKDILTTKNKQIFHCAAAIFSGTSCCRHTSIFCQNNVR